MSQFNEVFESSKANRTGVTMYFAGQTLSIVVKEIIGTEAVIGANQQYDKIVVRLDGLIAVAAN